MLVSGNYALLGISYCTNTKGRILLTDYRESEDLQTEPAVAEEETVEPEIEPDDRPLIARWIAWAKIIDR
jgi:hypothetical protein